MGNQGTSQGGGAATAVDVEAPEHTEEDGQPQAKPGTVKPMGTGPGVTSAPFDVADEKQDEEPVPAGAAQKQGR